MIVVLGLGRETCELLRVLDREDGERRVLLLEEAPAPGLALPDLAHLDVEVVRGADLDDPDVIPPEASAVYRSPGVSPYRPGPARARARGIPMTTPTGLWASRRDGADTIALSGTKGKSTTAAMVAHLLGAAGRRVALRGNIGRPALSADPDPAVDDVVLELSSYQLVDLRGRFAIGALTTLHRDHVPWHTSLERYHADKLRLLDLSTLRIASHQVSSHPRLDVDVHLVPAVPTERLRAVLRAAGVLGEHLVADAALALAVVDARLQATGGVGGLQDAFRSFQQLPHRLTPVATVGGVRWVDDSISTVPESAVAAAHAYLSEGPVTLLLGGDDRGQDLEPLVRLFADQRLRAVLLPALAPRLAAALEPVAGERVTVASDLAAAVGIAARTTPPGGSVVLSPAAPSFGTYRDFEQRGEHFTTLVAALT